MVRLGFASGTNDSPRDTDTGSLPSEAMSYVIPRMKASSFEFLVVL